MRVDSRETGESRATLKKGWLQEATNSTQLAESISFGTHRHKSCWKIARSEILGLLRVFFAM